MVAASPVTILKNMSGSMLVSCWICCISNSTCGRSWRLTHRCKRHHIRLSTGGESLFQSTSTLPRTHESGEGRCVRRDVRGLRDFSFRYGPAACSGRLVNVDAGHHQIHAPKGSWISSCRTVTIGSTTLSHRLRNKLLHPGHSVWPICMRVPGELRQL
ncbi:hypothetical protein EV363DRAFT_1322521, partial [Boletus edulis]